MSDAYVYILANKPNGVLYTGVTSNLVQRVWQHRQGLVDGFSKRYNLKRLVYFESHSSITNAIEREKNIKHWRRAWKTQLIEEHNQSWADLYPGLL